MSQDLLTISQEYFNLQLYKIGSRELMSLMKEIYDFKWDQGKKFSDDQIMDLERKETKINAELMRRGYLDKSQYADYFKWLKEINQKKKVW